jgi:NAD(P)H-dependent flavin oxidoreductase YrpB (nitropropane dioxygenase family)
MLPKVIDEADTIQVLAAGGIAPGADIRVVLSAGASGAALGTCFVATQQRLPIGFTKMRCCERTKKIPF